LGRGCDLLGEGRRGIGGRNITIIASVLAAWVFGSTAWQQFTPLPTAGRLLFSLAFAVWGGGAIWLVYGLVRLVIFLVRKARGS